MKTVKFESSRQIPNGFTGIAEYANGSKVWWLNGKLHRVDGPAVEGADGTKQWWLNGKRHRVDGPAIEFANGSKQWWLNDNPVFTLEPIREYLIIEDGLPSAMEWLDKPVSTLKVLTAKGFKYIPNLPGV
jgi:hypothetical protein